MSIGANLIEGRAASSRLEYKKFYEIALKSANETKYWLSLLKDAKYVESSKIDPLIQEVTEIANMLATGVIKLKSKNFWIFTCTFNFCILTFNFIFWYETE